MTGMSDKTLLFAAGGVCTTLGLGLLVLALRTGKRGKADRGKDKRGRGTEADRG